MNPRREDAHLRRIGTMFQKTNRSRIKVAVPNQAKEVEAAQVLANLSNPEAQEAPATLEDVFQLIRQVAPSARLFILPDNPDSPEYAAEVERIVTKEFGK